MVLWRDHWFICIYCDALYTSMPAVSGYACNAGPQNGSMICGLGWKEARFVWQSGTIRESVVNCSGRAQHGDLFSELIRREFEPRLSLEYGPCM